MFKRIRSRLTMRKVGMAFIDKIDGGTVYYWIDCYDVVWMAQSRFTLRVKAHYKPAIVGF